MVWEGDTYRFAPRAVDADGDALVFKVENRPRWATFDAATGLLRGVAQHADVGDIFAVRVGVSDGRHEIWLPAFDLAVLAVSHGDVLLSWVPPSENTDDSPVYDLAGFKLYWGTDPREPSDSVAIANANTLAYQFLNLSPGTYYFATAAVNAQGVESERSDVATMVVR